MATLTIRNLDDERMARLRLVAARHGHSMEDEVQSILRRSLAGAGADSGLGQRIHQRFASLGGVELELSARRDLPE